MVKKSSRKPPVRREEIDAYARALQALALVCVVGLIIISNTVEKFDMPPYVIPGILGMAIGLGPEQVVNLIKDVIKSALGRK